jgi:hypothetical protein
MCSRSGRFGPEPFLPQGGGGRGHVVDREGELVDSRAAGVEEPGDRALRVVRLQEFEREAPMVKGT